VGVHGLVHGRDRGLGRSVLRHVRGLTGAEVVTGVVERRGLLRHESGQLDVDVRHRERVRDRLVRPDRGVPHGSGLGIVHRAVQRVAGESGRERGGHDAFRVQPREELDQTRVLRTDERIRRYPDVVEEERELLLARDQLRVDLLVLERVGRHHEERGLELARTRVGGARDDEDGLSVVHTGDEDLAAVEDPLVAVAGRGGGQPVGVRARVGFGDGECEDERAVTQTGQPFRLLVLGAETRDDRGADRGRHDHHQQGAARRRELLQHGGQVANAPASAAVFGRDVDAEVPEAARLAPELGHLPAAARPAHVVLAPILAAQIADRGSQCLTLLAFAEGHDSSSMTSNISPSTT
jgi:hypothetical protein